MTADTSQLPPPATRWVLPALLRYSFSVAPGVATLSTVLAVLAGAAPVGITLNQADGLYAELFRLQARYFV